MLSPKVTHPTCGRIRSSPPGLMRPRRPWLYTYLCVSFHSYLSTTAIFRDIIFNNWIDGRVNGWPDIKELKEKARHNSQIYKIA